MSIGTDDNGSNAASADELTLEIPGLQLAAQAWGPADGLPAIGLHGWLDNAATYARLAPLLADRVRLVSLDLPGHGRSAHRPIAAYYDFIYWLPDVIAAADALGWERFSLIGHSMGAGIASLLAGALPERIERLVLIDGIGPMTAEADAAPEVLASAIADRSARLSESPQHYPDRTSLARRLVRAIDGLTLPAAELLLARGSREVDGGIELTHDRRLRGRSLLRLTEHQAMAFLRRIRCPTLMIRPRQGWPFPVDGFKARCAAVQTLRLVEVDGGHHVHLTDPERVAPLLGEFFAS